MMDHVKDQMFNKITQIMVENERLKQRLREFKVGGA